MFLTILIPCLNEAGTITRAVKVAQTALQKNKLSLSEAEIIVADNGSVDGSQQRIFKQGIAKLVTVPLKGYGAALHYGILHAKGKYVFFADADLSYDFKDLKKFLPLIQQKQYDLILGSRLKGKIFPGAMPLLHHYFGTPILTFLIRSMYRLPTSDSNSGMRLLRKKFYLQLQMHNSGMEWASELLIKTALQKGRYAEVPISLFPDQRNHPPHLLAWSDGWRHLKAIILLQPNSLFLGVGVFLLAGTLLIPISLTLTFFCILVTWGLFLSLLAAHLINFSLNQKKNLLVSTLLEFPLLPFCAIASLGVIIYISYVSLILGKVSFAGMFLISLIIILDVWLFFIETIKTHFLHRLPERVRK